MGRVQCGYCGVMIWARMRKNVVMTVRYPSQVVDKQIYVFQAVNSVWDASIPTLQAHLAVQTHRNLELIARAHQLSFSRAQPKAEGLQALADMLQAGAFARAFTTLEPAHIEALQALVVAGGSLPQLLFEAHFGQIRLYRPWRQAFLRAERDLPDNPRHPWRYPQSVAERLYHLGYIGLQAEQQRVVIIRDVLPLLPSLSIPIAETLSAQTRQGLKQREQVSNPRDDLLRDLAILLGTLTHANARAAHGRWFTLDVMRLLNERLTKPENLHDVRSELQTGRMRWLHYLAQVAGLLTGQADVLLPTAAAWRWLSAPADVQWDCLMAAVERDLEQHQERLWEQFRFPPIRAFTFITVRQMLDSLPSEQSYRVRDILTMLKPYLLPDSAYDVAGLMQQVFAWSGVLHLACGRIHLHPALAGTAERQTEIIQQAKQIVLPLPKAHSAAFTTLLSFATVEDDYAIVDAEAIRHAITCGLALNDVSATLSELSRDPLTAPVQQQLAEWFAAAQQLTLQTMIVLHSPDADLLRKIRSDCWK